LLFVAFSCAIYAADLGTAENLQDKSLLALFQIGVIERGFNGRKAPFGFILRYWVFDGCFGMKQFQFDYHSISVLKRDLNKIALWCKSRPYSHVVFQIYSDSLDRGELELVSDVISQTMPDAVCLGCSTNGNIIEGRLSHASISVVCTVFEYPTTRLKLLHYTLSPENIIDVARTIKEEIKANPWVKAVQLELTIRGMSMTPFCEAFSDLDPSIEIFGGGAFNPDLTKKDACVYSRQKGYSERGIVVLLMGGPDFFVYTTHITGWKPLGREFVVTRAKRATLYELDGCPAYEVYNRYLNIPNDKNFFYNTLEFPFFYKHNGIDILRAPVSCNEDGSLVMTSDIDENVKARLAYGDPWTILESVRRDGGKISSFGPEIIKVFSCAARRAFWGKEEISNETLPFQSIAATSGFYTSGEFLRTGPFVNQHNVTLVIAAMREGSGEEVLNFDMAQEAFSGKVSMINRLATFIDAATRELEQANEMLSRAARMDSLTGIYNRGEIQGIIRDAVACKEGVNTLLMMDIDYFKQVNDVFGHREGDNVIRGLSQVLQDVLQDTGGSAGRWGGDEFMIFLPSFSAEKACKIAETIRRLFEMRHFDLAKSCSISIGVTEIRKDETADDACSRVDSALYKAKGGGKNQVAVL